MQNDADIEDILCDDSLTTSFPVIKGESTLIKLELHKDLLCKWFDDRLLQLELIYRGSNFQFTAQSF